jgi:hypothetical protein
MGTEAGVFRAKVGWLKMVFDFLFGNKSERVAKSAEKFGNVLKNKVTTKEQRLEAIDVLMGIEDPAVSIPQLMKRFQIVIESGIQDKREKEICVDHIAKFGAAAQGLVEESLKTAERVAWPIKLAERLFERQQFVQLLIGALGDAFTAFDDQANNRNIEIILALKEQSDERIVEAVAGFLRSRDESVRMAALECLESQAGTSQRARELIKDLLNQEAHDDNSRYLGVVRTIVEKNAW